MQRVAWELLRAVPLDPCGQAREVLLMQVPPPRHGSRGPGGSGSGWTLFIGLFLFH